MNEDKRIKQTIQINHWDSVCGNCKKGASLDEGSHETVLGWSVPENEKKGCGMKWLYITSGYWGEKEMLEKQFPQYKYIDILFI